MTYSEVVLAPGNRHRAGTLEMRVAVTKRISSVIFTVLSCFLSLNANEKRIESLFKMDQAVLDLKQEIGGRISPGDRYYESNLWGKPVMHP